jgi:hypothetical protein
MVKVGSRLTLGTKIYKAKSEMLGENRDRSWHRDPAQTFPASSFILGNPTKGYGEARLFLANTLRTNNLRIGLS